MGKVTVINDFYFNEYGTWKSHECGVKVGELRVIDEKLYYAGSVFKLRWFRKPEVLWFEMRFEWLPENKWKDKAP